MVPSGWPDRYVVHPLWRGFFEAKVYPELPDPLQRRIIEGLIARGDNVIVAQFRKPQGDVRFCENDGFKTSEYMRFDAVLQYLNWRFTPGSEV